jgi:autotransporter-associated beta strand protein
MNTPNLTRRICGYVIVAASLMITAIAQAQNENVTWQAPADISGITDVNTQGTFYGSWAPYDGSANTLPVNGVVFQGYSSPPGFSAGYPQGDQNGYNGYANPNTANTNYNTLLQTATYASSGSGTITITWGDTPGHTYLIQVWANDGRGNGRSETITGGANTSGNLVFGNFPGQYIIGTYVADSSGSETITLSGGGSVNGDYPQINLLQLRDITSTAVTNYQSAVLADNPLAFYALNPASDPSGTSPDLTGNGNNGSDSSITPATGPTPYITNAANFNASEESYDDLSQGNNPGLLNFSGPITLEAWVQPSSSSEFGDVVAKGYDMSSYDEIVMRVNGPYGADYYGNSGSVGETGGTQTTNWTYVVVSSDGINCSLYINGGLVAQSSDPNGAVNFSDDWVIGNGSSAGNTRYFDGNISEVAIYNHGLTTAQVVNHYSMGELNVPSSSAPPIITAQPQSQPSYVGGSVTFSVGIVSALPTTNQWFWNSNPINGQTNASLTLSNLQLGSAGTYSVVVGNINGTTNSTAASLTVSTPHDLEWSSVNNSGSWDTDTSTNWINLANSQQTVFKSGDEVLFDDTPGVPTGVTVSGTVFPSLITVDSTNNNFEISSGTISGSGALVKEGPSTLTIDSAGNFTGPVTISGGAVNVGGSGFDSVSSITITNASTLDFGGSQIQGGRPVTVSGTGLDDEGALFNSTNDYPTEVLNILLAGDTSFGGTARWDLGSGSQITGAYTLTIDWSADSANGYYGQWNSVEIGAGLTNIVCTNALSDSGVTTALGMTGMDTAFQNPATLLTIGTNCQLVFYSGGFNGSIHILNGGAAYLWTPPSAFNGDNLILDGGASLESWGGSGNESINSAVTLNGVAHIVNGDHFKIYTNVISGPGGFVMDYWNNGIMLAAANTYTGPTIIGSSGNSPEVALTGNGSISGSSLIFFGGNSSTVTHIDVSGRLDDTLTLADGQTLEGIGGINGNLVVSTDAILSPGGTNTTIGITTGSNPVGTLAASGGVTLDGTTIIKLDGSTNDVVEAATNITYGGTLNLVNISGSPLATGNSFPVFNAASYSGSFATITPATPGPGLAWDTSQLSSGIINVVASSSSGPVIGGTAISGGNLVFSGSGGPANGTYYVLTSTNLTSPDWIPVATNSFDASGNFSVTNVVSSTNPQQYYRIELVP